MSTRGKGTSTALTDAMNGSQPSFAAVKMIPRQQAICLNLTVADEEVYHFFSRAAPEAREALAQNAIAAGVKLLGYSEAVSGADHVARRFKILSDQMDEVLQKTKEQLTTTIADRFDPARAGSYTAHLNQSLPKILGEALSLDKEDAPLARMKQESERQIREIGKQLHAHAERDKFRAATTYKGPDFEERLVAALHWMVESADTLEDVRYEQGLDGKAGDYRINVQNKGCKPWHPYGDNKIICSFDEDGLCLEVALRYARCQLLMRDYETEGISVAGIRQQLDRARTTMRTLSDIRKEAEGIRKSAAKMGEMIQDFEKSVRTALDSAEDCLP